MVTECLFIENHMTHSYRSPFFFLSGDVASSSRSCVTWPHTLFSIGSRSGFNVPASELSRADMAPGVWFWLLVDRSCPRPDGRFEPDSAPAELEAPSPLDRQLRARPPMSRGMNPLSMSDLFWTQHTKNDCSIVRKLCAFPPNKLLSKKTLFKSKHFMWVYVEKYMNHSTLHNALNLHITFVY